ncbi:MAG: hypothetical protein HQ478_14995 [Chloroflexi bacterium]|nr:hypothetical protein [Chloroflexota bacterium]
MRWLRAIAEWVSGAAEDVAEFVEDMVNTVVEFVSDIIETIGTFIAVAFEWVGDLLGQIPIIGAALEFIADWLGDSISAIFRVLAALVKGVGSIIGGVLGGVIRIVGGILSLNGRLILKGLWGIVSGVLGAIFVVATVLLGALQTLTFTQARSRQLNEQEIAILRRVYGDSIAFYNVRIIVGFAGALSLDSSRSAIVFGNTIYFKREADGSPREPVDHIPLFVHEACHVWQYQHMGSRYTSDALSAQILREDAYNWEGDVAGGVTSWSDLNREAQAEVFYDVWDIGQLITDGAAPVAGDGIFYDANGTDMISLMISEDGVDNTVISDEAVSIVRGVRSWRLSAWLS